ncbi:hypothetical protein BT93_L2857 [Corymbia citriodora subsp. variegata]|uniref:PGG domain-containing protein n=1 Tax=Corymbia citriodora subsp. variegata TaxID=360336 RepID=A0A8T0CJ02_CORYI|nr:hypothetical protein BT93_L2857 [Corymbia citriodora subsp. variegata]
MEFELYKAAEEGSVPSLLELLGKDRLLLDRIVTWNRGETPLHVAAMLGHLRFVEELLARKAELAQEQDYQGFTPLHIAAAKGYFRIVARLLEFGPEVCFVRDMYERNPLHVAAMKGQEEILEILVREKPEAAHEIFEDGQTIFHLCVKYNRLQCLKLLMNFLRDDQLINSRDKDGNTILHLAAAQKQTKIILFLSDIGIDPNVPNYKGFSSLALLAHVESLKNDSEISEIVDKTVAVHAPGGKEIEKAKKRKKRQDNTFETLLVVGVLFAGIGTQGGMKLPDNIWEIYFEGPKNDRERKFLNVHKFLMESNMVSLIASLAIVFVLTSLPFKRQNLISVAMVIFWIAMICAAVAYGIPLLMITPNDESQTTYKTVGVSVLCCAAVMVIIVLCHFLMWFYSALKWSYSALKWSYSALKKFYSALKRRRQREYVTI